MLLPLSGRHVSAKVDSEGRVYKIAGKTPTLSADSTGFFSFLSPISLPFRFLKMAYDYASIACYEKNETKSIFIFCGWEDSGLVLPA
jgi:hypothetical protein